MEKADIPLCKIISRKGKDLPVIFIHDLTVIYSHNIIKAASLMHAKCQGTVFYFISEGKFHLIPVAIAFRTLLDPFKDPWSLLSGKSTCKKLSDLSFLDLHFFFIGQRHIRTATTGSKVRTYPARFKR